jgi:ketosteroid isomerase-like protein
LDDLYLINVAKTEFREAYCAGNVDRLIAITDANFVDFSDERRGAFGDGARQALREHFETLFSRFKIELRVIIIEIRLAGNVAYDYGWQEFYFTPKGEGTPFMKRERYADIWRKDKDGNWKLWMFMSNRDVPDVMKKAV